MGSSDELEADWPNLAKTKYQVTSSYTPKYNCLAWAAHDTEQWWSPLPVESYYWPENVPREVTLSAFIKAYQTCGFEVCEEAILELGFEKIAIYTTPDGQPQHIARQLENGMWTSKLGRFEDIEHELNGLTGELYGTVKQIMKRPLQK